MKTIGRTNEGKILVECSSDEIRAFDVLAETAKGRTFSEFYIAYADRQFDSDMLPVFQAIYEWLQVKDRSNALRVLADDIDRLLKANGGAK